MTRRGSFRSSSGLIIKQLKGSLDKTLVDLLDCLHNEIAVLAHDPKGILKNSKSPLSELSVIAFGPRSDYLQLLIRNDLLCSSDVAVANQSCSIS